MGSRPIALGIALATALGLTSAVSAASAATLQGQKITFGATTCAPHWNAPNPGRAHFAVYNQSGRSATVLFFEAKTNKIVAKLTDLHAHGSAELVAKVRANHSYLWGCDLQGGVKHSSEPERVPRDPTHGGAGHYVPPIQASQVGPALSKYRAYVRERISALAPAVEKLHSQLATRDKSGAESAWLTAHLIWLRIGQDDGAYGIYGDLGRTIDGTAAGYPRGTKDPAFTGFHRIELDLWRKHNLAAATSYAAKLEQSVDKLSHLSLKSLVPDTSTGASNFILRTHEVIEDAVRDTLSGDDEYGSGTALASITADVSAVREILGLLSPLIKPRSPSLVSKARHDLSRLLTQAKTGRAHGRWIAIAKLHRKTREDIDAAAGAADEELAPVPDLLRIGNS
jgi:iron uptake system EfeUOB component EfeO/EfeM